MKAIYNAEALVSVEIHKAKPIRHFEWRDAYEPNIIMKMLGHKPIPEGFRFLYTLRKPFYVSNEQITSGNYGYGNGFIYEGTPLLILDKRVCYRPYVKLNFAGGVSDNQTFDTYQLADQYATELALKFDAPLILPKYQQPC